MASVHIRRRLTKSGVRYCVSYRLGGRDSKQVHAGTFERPQDAEALRAWISERIAAGTMGGNRPNIAPPIDSSRRRPRMVYIAEFGGLFKIGVSVDPVKRCAALHAELLHTEPGGVKRERELHERFRRLRVRGEWFRSGKGQIRRYIAYAQRESS